MKQKENAKESEAALLFFLLFQLPLSSGEASLPGKKRREQGRRRRKQEWLSLFFLFSSLRPHRSGEERRRPSGRISFTLSCLGYIVRQNSKGCKQAAHMKGESGRPLLLGLLKNETPPTSSFPGFRSFFPYLARCSGDKNNPATFIRRGHLETISSSYTSQSLPKKREKEFPFYFSYRDPAVVVLQSEVVHLQQVELLANLVEEDPSGGLGLEHENKKNVMEK